MSFDLSKFNLFKKKNVTQSSADLITSPFPTFYEKQKQSSGKKVISFSLFGSKPLYFLGAELNIKEAKEIYPDFICRFYCTQDVPNLEKLKSLAEAGECELIVPDLSSPPIFWRILACDDPHIDVCLQRDCDSIVNHREKAAVDAWLNSSKTLHLMHDCKRGHFHKVMAGMWGIKKTDKFNFSNELNQFFIQKKYKSFDTKTDSKSWGSGVATYFDDQYFLKDIMFKQFEDDYLEHGEENPFPTHEPINYGSFVGDRVLATEVLDLDNFLDKETIFLQSHLAIDDQMPLNGMIRYFHSLGKKIIFAVRESNLNVIKHSLSDLENLSFHKLLGNDDGIDWYLKDYDVNKIGLLVVGSGGKQIHENLDFIDKCYKQAGLDPSIRKSHSFIPNTSCSHLSQTESSIIDKYKKLYNSIIEFNPFNQTNPELFSITKNKKVLAFHTNEIGVRGSEWAAYKYAHYNETLLGNDSIYIAGPKTSQFERPESHKVFSERFKVYRYEQWSEVDEILRNESVDILYMHKGGSNDGKFSNRVRTCIHACFQMLDIHGDRYAYNSEWLSQKMSNGDVPFVPLMVDLFESNLNLRSELNIPDDAIVFGRFGGPDQFDIKFVHEAIEQVLNDREDVYFLFGFTNEFINHPRVIYQPPFCDEVFKTKFINTCDAMLHARHMGESFGLAIAEFSSKNKPVITYQGGNDQAHLDMLKDKALYYTNKEEVYTILNNFTKELSSLNWDAYSENYNPEIVMQKFKEVYIN